MLARVEQLAEAGHPRRVVTLQKRRDLRRITLGLLGPDLERHASITPATAVGVNRGPIP